MSKIVAVVIGATGQIGQVVTEELLKRGYEVRAVGRNQQKLGALQAKGAKSVVASFDDGAALMAAFKDAAAAFSFIPPAYDADDFSAYQDRAGEAVAAALKQQGVRRVVNLSSLGADRSSGTGPIAGLHRHEQRLNELPVADVVHLRAAYFMENQLFSIPLIKQQGINGSPIRGGAPIHMVATRDIGVRAAELLDQPGARARSMSIVELVGPRSVTLNEMTTVLGRAIGKPDLRYVQFSYADAEQTMCGMGMKPKSAALMVEMYRAFNDGWIAPTQEFVRGSITITEFAKLFAEVYQKS